MWSVSAPCFFRVGVAFRISIATLDAGLSAMAMVKGKQIQKDNLSYLFSYSRITDMSKIKLGWFS
jgi:hypothetical protein